MKQKNQYKVLVIPAWFNHQNKQDGIFIHQFCESLQKNGHLVSLLYLQIFSIKQFWKYFKPIRFSYSNNFNVIILKKIVYPLPKILKSSVSFFKKSLVRKAILVIEKEKFDIIHIQSVCNNITPFLAYEISKKLKIPFVVSEHYSSFKEAGNAIFYPYMDVNEVKKIVQNANIRIGVSDYACMKFEDFFECKFLTFPNIVNEAFFKKANLQNLKDNKNFHFLIIAALEKHKGQSILLKAFKKAFSHEPNIYLNIIGKGSDEAQLKNEVCELNLLERVKFIGSLSHEEIINEIDRSNIIVSSSLYETFGLTIVEGFLRGNPVLSTRSGGPNELINETNGLLCNVNDLEDLTKTLKKIFEIYRHFDFTKIQEDAIKKFSPDTLISNLVELYALTSKPKELIQNLYERN